MSWLTNLFRKKQIPEEDQTEYLDYSELPHYIKSITNPKEKDLERLFKELQERIYQLEDSLIQLKNAKIQEPNPKIVNVILGNRESYIQHTKIFIDTIQIPEEITFTKTKQFCSQFEHSLKEFTEKSTKAFQITKNLIGDELEDVAKKIKEIDDYVKEIKLFLEEENAEQLIEIKKQTDAFLNTLNLKKNNLLDIKKLNEKIAQIDFSQQKILEEINNLSNTDDFSKLNGLKQQNQEIQNKINELNSSLINLFSPIDKSLRKFNKISPDSLIEEYIENPINALQKDSQLRILNVLRKVEASLIDNQLDIKDDKKEKTLESIKEISEEFITTILTEYTSLKNEKNAIKNKLLINKTEEKLMLLNEKLNNFNNRKKSLQLEIQQIEKKIPSNIDGISQNLAEKIKNINSREIKIQTKDI